MTCWARCWTLRWVRSLPGVAGRPRAQASQLDTAPLRSAAGRWRRGSRRGPGGTAAVRHAATAGSTRWGPAAPAWIVRHCSQPAGLIAAACSVLFAVHILAQHPVPSSPQVASSAPSPTAPAARPSPSPSAASAAALGQARQPVVLTSEGERSYMLMFGMLAASVPEKKAELKGLVERYRASTAHVSARPGSRE